MEILKIVRLESRERRSLPKILDAKSCTSLVYLYWGLYSV
jgi:hypothetical protein